MFSIEWIKNAPPTKKSNNHSRKAEYYPRGTKREPKVKNKKLGLYNK